MQRVLVLIVLIGTETGSLRAQSSVAKPLPLDPAALVARDDSFAVRLQGADLGWISSRLEQTPDGARYVEKTSVGDFVEQTTIVELSASGAVRRIQQRGKAQGQSTAIELGYRNNRVTGTATATTPNGPTTLAIDTTVPDGTIDENAIQALLPALPWADRASWQVGVFSGTQNEYQVTTLAVVSTDTVTLAGGPVAAFRAEWTGAWQPATFWISTRPPHRVLRIAVSGAPVDVVRVR